MGAPLIHRPGRSCRPGALVVLLAALLVCLAACSTYEGRVIHQEGTTVASQRPQPLLPLSALLVIETRRKQQQLTVNKSVYRVYPDVTDALAQYLRTLFSSVDIVDESQLGDTRQFILLYPDISTHQDYATLNVTLGWRVVDGATGREVARMNVDGTAETEKTFMETLTGRSMDLVKNVLNDKSFSGALNSAAQTSVVRLRGTLKQRRDLVAAAAPSPSPQSSVRPQAVAAAQDTKPPVIEIFSPAASRGLAVRQKESRVAVTGRAIDESGIAEVFINGAAAQVDAQGGFSGEALLKPGANEIVVSAVDTRNNSASVRLTVQRDAQEAAAATRPGTAVRKVALLIGINRYRHLEPLKTAVADVRAVADLLAAQYGYETRLLLDEQATHDAIMKELNQIRERLTAEDKLLIYYAGHGILEQATESSYWLPIDAEPKDDTKWLDSKRISDHLKRMSARQILVVADSCYSGTISRSVSAELSRGELRDNYLRKIQSRPSRVLISSGGNEPVSDSGGGGHSIFASVFLEALRHPPTVTFTAAELLTGTIKESVAGRSAQTPEHKIIRNSGHDSGDFVFEKLR